jgi:hypothetical protein
MVRFYRDLIDAYLAAPRDQPFDLSPWQSLLLSIQTERDAARSDGTRRLLAEARLPVVPVA